MATALDELAKTPPDNAAAAGILTGVVTDIQAMIDAGHLTPPIGQQHMDEVNSIISQL